MATKGKAKAKQTDLQNLQKSTRQYEGAIDNAYFVQCYMRNGEQKKARIIDCRLRKDYDLKRKKTDSSYDYYIHYEGFNRRLDEWVPRSRIELTDKIIDSEPEKKKKQKIDDKREQEENDEHEGMDEASLRAHEEATKFKTISSIEIGKFRTECWYYSPFPTGYHNIDTLYVCEFCLSYYKTRNELNRHIEKCKLTHPPGDEVYRHDTVSLFEIDGHKNPTYCENLCSLSKLFLDHKNLFYDVEPFLFYILCESDQYGHHIMGYFSKEKESQQGYNLSCILVFPFAQRKGYGKFLITFSYELALKENKIGTPERPLSDLGKASYLSWWIQRIITFMKDHQDENFCIADISKETGIKETDIIWSLEQKQLIKYIQGQIYICTDINQLEKIYKSAGKPGRPVITENIHWVTFKFKYDFSNK